MTGVIASGTPGAWVAGSAPARAARVRGRVSAAPWADAECAAGAPVWPGPAARAAGNSAGIGGVVSVAAGSVAGGDTGSPPGEAATPARASAVANAPRAVGATSAERESPAGPRSAA
jgi:hypothetical protein